MPRMWRSIHRNDLFPIHPRTLISGLGGRRDHIVPDRPLKQLISRHLGIERLEEAAVPVHIVTFDLRSGEEVRLSEGPAIEAVAAAAAVPGVFPPVAWEERLLVDGGVVNNTPISHAVELGADRIYVLPTADPTDRGWPLAPRGAMDAAIHAFTLLVGSRLQADLARYAEAAELIVLPAANGAGVQPTDFDHSARLIASALNATRAALSDSTLSRPIAA
jgi:NTE family protein